MPASLWICCAYLCSFSVCVHRGGKLRYDKVEKQTSTSEPSRAPSRESDHECNSSITPISLLHLDMTPQCVACYHRVVFLPLHFCFFLYPTSTPTVSPTAFTGGYSSKVDEPFFLQSSLWQNKKKHVSVSMHTMMGVKALG